MDKVFTVRQVYEKYLANGKEVFLALFYLEKAYDTIDLDGMWHLLRVYGVGEKFVKAVLNFYVYSRTCGDPLTLPLTLCDVSMVV